MIAGGVKDGLRREPQGLGVFEPGVLSAGYYNDLTSVPLGHGGAEEARAAIAAATIDRAGANPVSIAQLGLGAWQLGQVDRVWLDVARAAGDWLVSETRDDGTIAYLVPMAHTYSLAAPWTSAMAQGQACSLLARLADMDIGRGLEQAAARVAVPLLDPALGLVVGTSEGPVLQEYPTSPPAHVLNGWIFAP